MCDTCLTPNRKRKEGNVLLAFAVLILWMAFLVGLHLREKAAEARREAERELIEFEKRWNGVPATNVVIVEPSK